MLFLCLWKVEILDRFELVQRPFINNLHFPLQVVLPGLLNFLMAKIGYKNI